MAEERKNLQVRIDTEIETAIDAIASSLAKSMPEGFAVNRSDAVRHAILSTYKRLLAESEGKAESKGKAK